MEPIVADFGFARSLDDGEDEQTTVAAVGPVR